MHGPGYLRSTRFVVLVAALCVAAPARQQAAAQEQAPWVVFSSQGQVTQQGADGTEIPVEPGATLAEDSPIKTGADGTLVLAHGNDLVTVSANSAFSIPRDADPATSPSILQTLGTLLFKVEHTPARRFEIQTPYLAAVVKGTVFTVTVSDAGNSVHVAEGAVEVTALASRDVALIHPGQTVLVSSSGRTMSVVGAKPEIKSEHRDPDADRQKNAETEHEASVLSSGADDAGRITQTLGDVHLDVSTLTKGLVKPGIDRRPADGAAAPATTVEPGAGGTSDPSSEVTGRNPNAAGGNPVAQAAGAPGPNNIVAKKH